MKALIIGHVWPEPGSSAAGARINEIMHLLFANGWNLTFASASQRGEFVGFPSGINVNEVQIELNSSTFDVWLKELKPDLVMFDRFMSEEQYGWRVAEKMPQAVRILDTEDLHFLRHARAKQIQNRDSDQEIDFFNSDAFREIAAIYRSDLSLIISNPELALLKNTFNIPDDLLVYLPFCRQVQLHELEKSARPEFEQRSGYTMIGSFQHAPNRDAVLNLKENIWPAILKRQPNAELHIYGSYMQAKDRQLHDVKSNFFMHGRVEDALATIQKHRVMLAPLRFGAGLKGKLVDAMQCGTPFVTTDVGAEGIHCMPQSVLNDVDGFAQRAVTLHNQKNEWNEASLQGSRVFREQFADPSYQTEFLSVLNYISADIENHRKKNFTGAMLMHHRMQSTRFLSKWIEEKNKKG